MFCHATFHLSSCFTLFSRSKIDLDVRFLQICSSPTLLIEPGNVPRRKGNSWKFCKAVSQGFGPQPKSKAKKSDSLPRLDGKQISTKKGSGQENTEASSGDLSDANAPNLVVGLDLLPNSRKETSNSFEERLAAIKRSAEEMKRAEEEKMYGPIDYDAPVSKPDAKEGLSLPVKVGIGIAVVVFGVVFAFGDLFPSGEVVQEKTVTNGEMSTEELGKLKERLQGYEAILKIHPDDLNALEGAAVTFAELGDYSKSEMELEKLLQAIPTNVEALRLLGEVQNALGKYEQAAATYRTALAVSPKGSITLLIGLVDSLVSQGKQNQAVEEIIAARDRVKSSEGDVSPNEGKAGEADELNSVQIELLLGKTYSDWGHVSDAVAVYESIITNHPEDFRGYLAKAILLKAQGQKGEAERMFIQARYLAPERLKSLVDRYSKR